MLPVSAPVTEGLGAVNDSGVRSRGLTFATGRGAPVMAPADGVVRFSGPFRDYDGVADHRPWRRLDQPDRQRRLDPKPGDKVASAQPIGRALGPLEVELSQNGRRFSPLSSQVHLKALSKNGKGG